MKAKNLASPRFFIYENTLVKEVTEQDYFRWINVNWHPGHLEHAVIPGRKDEVWLGFQGHYKYCEWKNKPFNVTYFVYGNEIEWAEVHDEYYTTYDEALMRFHELAEKGYLQKDEAVLRAA